MAEIDLEILIELVHNEPVLWDKTQEKYKDRIATKNAWIKIFKQLNGGFEEMSQQARNYYGKSVMKKWSNIRDAFQRRERKCKDSMKSGSESQPPKMYIYGQQLQFLKRTKGQTTDDSYLPSTETLQPHELSGNNSDVEDEFSSSVVAESVISFKKPDEPNQKKRKLDPVELISKLVSTIKQKPDRHSSFFNGILPSLETFDDDEVVEFQLKVLQVISDIKKSKKQTEVIYQDTNF